MKRSIVFSVRSFAVLRQAARIVEHHGLDRAWMTETPGRDALMRAVEVAGHTRRIGVGTGIAYAFTRHPLAMAAAAIEANEVTGGRLTLGVGTGPADFRSALGVDFTRPAARLGEYLALVRAALTATDGLDFQGEFYRTRLDSFGSAVPLENRAAIRVYGSGMTPASLRAMSRAAHGIALHPLAAFAPYLEGTALPSIAETGASPAIAAWCVTSVHPDAGRAMREARARLALYLSVPGLGRVADGTPWEKDVARLRQAAPAHHGRPDWAALGELVPPDLAEELAVVGSPDEAAEKLASRREGLGRRGIDELVLQPAVMGGTDERLLEAIEATAAAWDGVS
ncbi:LLM class flavin-dependent oxidoreductase [Actinomadura madurae]|uniref:LLM class flavin-dependent oxidoreductase n=1 Tax=Actinomadura madurae TaxID=1993 RepID=UPI0020265DEB|nr:LLM class flavin-dependent oxidoreductase [Actinomadura madurae]URN01020.1 LLM class flavin-dependent oxidoreductase [Actinomadura madurae]